MPEKLEIWGVNDPNVSAQLALAAKLDLFQREANLDVTCIFIESGTTMANDVLKAAKKPLALTQTPITALLLREHGVRAKILAPLADIAGTQQVVIHAASGIISPQDLEDKRIGMARESAVYIAVKNMASDCNVDLNKIQFVDLLPHEQLAAFEAGQIEAVACWEPWTTRAQALGGAFYFSGTRSEIPGMEEDVNWLIDQSCLIVPEEYLQQQPDLVIAVLNVFRKATDLINHHRKEVLKELASFFGLSRVELMTTMQENTYSLALDHIFELGVLSFRDFLYENGWVSQKFAEQELYDTAFLQQVDRSLVSLQDKDAQSVRIVKKGSLYYRKDMAAVGNAAPLRFLLADDSRYVRTAIKQAVAVLGGEVVGEATTGSAAIDQFVRLRPNFVTMDLSMPGVSGVDAVKSILQIDPQANIIVISGADLEEVREEIFNLGIKIFITKPFDPELVAEIIGLLLL